MITEERRDELHSLFWSETNEDYTQEWRDELNAEEAALVAQWDKQADAGMLKLCKAILEVNGK